MGLVLNANGFYINLGGLVLAFEYGGTALLILFVCLIAVVAAVVNFKVFKAKPTAEVERVPIKDQVIALAIAVATCLTLSLGIYISLIYLCGAVSEIRGPAVISAPIMLVGDPFTLAIAVAVYASFAALMACLLLRLLNRMKVGRGKWLMVALAVSAMPLWSLSGVFSYDQSVELQTYMMMVLMQSMFFSFPWLFGGLTATYVLRHRNLKRKSAATAAC